MRNLIKESNQWYDSLPEQKRDAFFLVVILGTLLIAQYFSVDKGVWWAFPLWAILWTLWRVPYIFLRVKYVVNDEKPLTKMEIIDETVKFYSEDPSRRALSGGDYGPCVFNAPENKHCAVGRCLLKKYHKLGNKLKSNDGNIFHLFRDNGVKSLDEMLEPRYRGHETKFWEHIQLLHDSELNFDYNGLTEVGVRSVKYLKELYKN